MPTVNEFLSIVGMIPGLQEHADEASKMVHDCAKQVDSTSQSFIEMCCVKATTNVENLDIQSALTCCLLLLAKRDEELRDLRDEFRSHRDYIYDEVTDLKERLDGDDEDGNADNDD